MRTPLKWRTLFKNENCLKQLWKLPKKTSWELSENISCGEISSVAGEIFTPFPISHGNSSRENCLSKSPTQKGSDESYNPKAYLVSCQTSLVEFFLENSLYMFARL